jgi:hypothetical protein
MLKTWIGSDAIFYRTVELLKTASRMPPAPYPTKWRDESGSMMGWVFGPVSRPEFVIDDVEVPY